VEKKSKILDYLVGKKIFILRDILAYIEKDGEKCEVVVAGIDILYMPRSFDGVYSDLWDIGGIGFICEKKEEAVEYFRVLYNIKNSGLYKGLVRELMHIGRVFRDEEVNKEFYMSWRKSKYKCKISRRDVGYKDYTNVFEIHTGEEWRWREGNKREERIALEIIGKVFENEIKEIVRERVSYGRI
jgi:hypothetical protein